jgi:hypothetical protein
VKHFIRFFRVVRGLSLFSAFLCLFTAVSTRASDLKKDEEIIFFPVVAQRVEKGAAWEAEIQGWVYEPERRKLELELFRKALGVKKEESAENDNALFVERARTFMVDNERGKTISIRIGDKVYPLGKTDSQGQVLGRVRFPAGMLKSDRATFYAVTATNDQRIFAGEIHLLDDTGLSVVSDIDDTLKISELKEKKTLLLNTFFRPFQPVPGMAAVYQGWMKTAGAKFHYVSASPRQLYPSLADFILANDFPVGTFHLKTFRWKDETFLDFFKSPDSFKLVAIEPLLKRFPNRHFILVGDSGQRDPEIYSALARKHPKQIVRICIRDLTNETKEAERYRKVFQGLPGDLWKVFHDPKEIEELKGLL